MRVVRQALVGLASLLALVVATAAAAAASLASISLIAQFPRTPNLSITLGTLLLCGSLVAGAVYAAFLLARRLPRTFVVLLGLIPIGLLAYREWLLGRFVVSNGRSVLVLSGIEREVATNSLAPTVAGAVLGIALIVAALTRRDVPNYSSPLQAWGDMERAWVGPAVVGVIMGAIAWLGTGLAEVSLAIASGQGWPLVDATGSMVRPESVAYASSSLAFYLVGGGAAVVAGALYALLLSSRLPPAAPIVVGSAYAIVPIVLVATVAQHASEPVFAGGSDGKLLAALQVAAAAPATAGAAVLLAVPLIIAGVVRLRARAAARPAMALPVDPTIELF